MHELRQTTERLATPRLIASFVSVLPRAHREDEMRNWMSSFLVGIVGLTITAPSGALAGTESVEPTLFIRSNLVREQAGSFEVNHDSLCVMRDAEARASERARVRVYATAPAGVISRDQLVALVTRLESVFLMGIGEVWRPGATAMTMAQILDCRPRRSSSGDADQEMRIVVTTQGFEATFLNHRSGASSSHSETWAEAFRP
jgi:hypothetical protein